MDEAEPITHLTLRTSVSGILVRGIDGVMLKCTFGHKWRVMAMGQVNTVDARAQFSEIINRAAGCMWPPVRISDNALDQTVHLSKCKTPTSRKNTAPKAGETILDAQ